MSQTADSDLALRVYPAGLARMAADTAVTTVRSCRGVNGLLTCAAALLVAAGLLVSCAERSDLPTRTADLPATVALPPADPEPAPIPTSPVPKVKPKPKPVVVPAVVAPQQLPEVAMPEARRQTAALAAKIDPGVLVGMTEGETLDLLGKPAWTQEIPPAKTWQYASERCVLRVFMFMEMTTRDFRTLSYELTSTDEQPDVDQQCLAELVAQAWGEGTQHGSPRPHRTGG